MGWCQEFGLHIVVGCDHVMVAGHAACSCPDCETICTGRFEGCPIVWSTAAAPVPVAMTATVHASPVPVPVPVPVRVPVPAPALDPGHAEEPSRPSNGKSAARSAATALGDFPVDIPPATLPPPLLLPTVAPNGKAAGGAEVDLHQMCADLKFEVRRLSRTVDRLADAGQRADRQAGRHDADARFELLATELSDRLVVLGNEILAIKRHLGADRASDAEE